MNAKDKNTDLAFRRSSKDKYIYLWTGTVSQLHPYKALLYPSDLLLLILMMWLIGKRAQVHTINIKCIFNWTCPLPPKIE